MRPMGQELAYGAQRPAAPQWAFHLLKPLACPSGIPPASRQPPLAARSANVTGEPLSGSVTGTGHTPGLLQIIGQIIFSFEQSTTGVRWKTIWKVMTGQAKVAASQLERNRSTGFGEEERGAQECSAYLCTYRGKEDVFSCWF